MVDVKVMNKKLEERAIRIISEITGLDRNTSRNYLLKANMKPKLAILMILSGKDKTSGKKQYKRTRLCNRYNCKW